jgi:Flp pilus assembly pilin Flp
MNLKTPRNMKGFTMVELMIIFVIIGIVLTAAMPKLKGLLSGSLVSADIAGIERTVGKLQKRTMGNNEAITSAMDNQYLIEGNLLSEDLSFDDASFAIYNKFRKEVTFVGIDTNGWSWSSDIPTDQCADYVTEGKMLGAETVDANGTVLIYSDTLGADINAACQSSNDFVTIEFVKEGS